MALSVQPELAPAHYLRGWAAYLSTQDPEIALQEVAVAAAIAPDDLFYRQSVDYLLGDDLPVPQATPDGAAEDVNPTTLDTGRDPRGDTGINNTGRIAHRGAGAGRDRYRCAQA